ncbi:urease subunit beta [Streptomyces rimosus]|uniref:urease subunit beta n=1 Tax=Streptomyces rimosus TaxID=1927 RepID=UPI0031DBA389
MLHPGKIEHPRPPRLPDCPVDCDDSRTPYCCEKCDERALWHEAIAFNENLQGNPLAQGNLQDDLKTITVKNVSDRPIQVGSHYHFAEINPGLKVITAQGTQVELKNCADAKNRRLNISAGSSVRFEPGDECCVELVKFGGPAKTYTKAIMGLRKGTV